VICTGLDSRPVQCWEASSLYSGRWVSCRRASLVGGSSSSVLTFVKQYTKAWSSASGFTTKFIYYKSWTCIEYYMVNMTRLTVDFKIMTLFHMNMWQTIQDTAVVSVERQQEVIMRCMLHWDFRTETNRDGTNGFVLKFHNKHVPMLYHLW